MRRAASDALGRRRRARSALIAALLAGVASEAPAIWVADTRAPYDVAAPLEFRLEVGRFLFLQVGSPGATVDTLSFDLGGVTTDGGAAPQPVWGSGLPLTAVGGGVLDVVVRSNAGAVSLSASNDGAGRGLSNGAGGFISYREIVTSSDDTGLPAPVLTDVGSNLVQVSPTAYGGLVTDRRARWAYRYANTGLPAPGNYRGQVVYTAAVP